MESIPNIYVMVPYFISIILLVALIGAIVVARQ